MGFIMENIRVIGIVYLIGAIITFILYDKITQEYPQLMGGMNDTEEKENGKE